MLEVESMSEQQRKYAMLGGFFGLLYLVGGSILPDFLMGVLLGLGILFFVLALLPGKAQKRMRKWKRRGK